MKSRSRASAVLPVLATLSLPAAAAIDAVTGLAATRGKTRETEHDVGRGIAVHS